MDCINLHDYEWKWCYCLYHSGKKLDVGILNTFLLLSSAAIIIISTNIAVVINISAILVHDSHGCGELGCLFMLSYQMAPGTGASLLHFVLNTSRHLQIRAC